MLCWLNTEATLLYFNLTSSYMTSTRVLILLCTTQDSRCTCNVTLRSVRITVVAVEKQQYCIFWMCVCVCVCVCLYSCLSSPAFKLHASYHTVVCGLYGSTTFFHIISQMTRFSGEKISNIKCVFFYFFYNFVWDISHYEKNLTSFIAYLYRS